MRNTNAILKVFMCIFPVFLLFTFNSLFAQLPQSLIKEKVSTVVIKLNLPEYNRFYDFKYMARNYGNGLTYGPIINRFTNPYSFTVENPNTNLMNWTDRGYEKRKMNIRKARK